MKKLLLKYQMVTKTYLKHLYLPDYVTVVTVVTVVEQLTVLTVVTVVTKVTVVTVVTKKTFCRQKKLFKIFFLSFSSHFFSLITKTFGFVKK